jgi:hypothetical protein
VPITERTPTVFISYSHTDKSKVDPIVTHLVRAGYNVWQDERRLFAGDALVPELSKAISEADFYLVFLSKNSVNSPYVQYELTNAMTLQITKNRPRVLPVRLDESEVPTILEGFMYIRMESTEQTITSILKTMEQMNFSISRSKNESELIQEIRMTSFSFFICDKTRLIDSFTHKELEDKVEEIKKDLRKKANGLLLHIVPVEDITVNTSDIPYVSFKNEVKDTGSIDVENKEVCWEVEILNPNENKIVQFISDQREKVTAVQYSLLLPSPRANLGSDIYKNIMRAQKRRIDAFDEEGGVSYTDEGRKFVVLCNDRQITIKVESLMPLIRNADVEKFNIRNIVTKLISGID